MWEGGGDDNFFTACHVEPIRVHDVMIIIQYAETAVLKILLFTYSVYACLATAYNYFNS